ncbi:MAG: ABC transporter ATP-binding protein/permease [Clostridiales bacterium]|jgi:ATP-binding cassette subfamily B protein|nr:ABC transporter ATP-binding protein/permease [Clostridiales bacterium]
MDILKSKNKKINLRHYIKKHKFLSTGYVIASLFSQICNIVSLFLIAMFLAELTAGNFDKSLVYLFCAVGFYLGFEFFYAVIYKFFYSLVAKISYKIKVDLIEQVFKISSKSFAEKSSGVFINRINNDPERALWSIENIADNIVALITAFFTMAYIFLQSWIIGSIFLLALVILFIWELFRTKVYAKNERQEKTSSDASNGLTAEIIKSEKDIKALDLEEQLKIVATQNFAKQSSRLQKKYVTNMYFWSSRGMAVQIVIMLALMVGVFWVRNTALSIASFLFIFTNRVSFENIIWRFGNTATELANLKVATSRMFELMDNNKFKVEEFGDKKIKINGNIQFENVRFSYVDAAQEEDDQEKTTKIIVPENKKVVFENLNFEITANTTVAFVGKSGSGKSTILSLIAKLYDATENGTVKIDGVDIKELSRDTLRQGISLVNQFPYIFNTTILQNIKMAKQNATVEQVEEAAKKACLHEFIMSLKNGYQTKVGESGIKLSGGQRQRLAIARALLKRSKIILFDESTSSLDNTTQDEIKQSLTSLAGNHTIVIVAHRLSTIKNADTIYFVHEGEIKASGNFDYLIANCNQFEQLFKAEMIV